MNIVVFDYLCLWSLQGGVDDEVTLSAYITIALLEMPLPVTVSTSTFPVPASHKYQGKKIMELWISEEKDLWFSLLILIYITET